MNTCLLCRKVVFSLGLLEMKITTRIMPNGGSDSFGLFFFGVFRIMERIGVSVCEGWLGVV